MLDPPFLQSGYYMIALVTTQELLIFAYVQALLAALLIGLIIMHSKPPGFGQALPGGYTVLWYVKGFQWNYHIILTIVDDSYLDMWQSCYDLSPTSC